MSKHRQATPLGGAATSTMHMSTARCHWALVTVAWSSSQGRSRYMRPTSARSGRLGISRPKRDERMNSAGSSWTVSPTRLNTTGAAARPRGCASSAVSRGISTR